ncbi:cyclodeaminase/cyclohydrolase family protein [Methylothermus subterraneus]
MLKDQSIQTFLDRLAGPSATPGGGSAAALMGAMGAALVSMVANLTLGKPKYQALEGEMQALLQRAETLRERLAGAAEADIAAFDEVMAAYRLPKATETDRAHRQRAVQAALKAAAEVPLTCAHLCAEVLELCRQAAERGNPNAIIDAGVGALAAHAALKACALNVAANLNAIEDSDFTQACRAELDLVLDAHHATAEAILATIHRRLWR